MARYVILRDPDHASSASRPAVLAMRDGFSILAFAISPLWLLWHRLWFAAFLVIAASIALAFVALEPRFAWIVLPANLALSLLVGLEGQGWRIARAGGRGYRPVDVVDANTRQEAELRFAEPYFGRTAETGDIAPVQRPAVPDVLFDVPTGAAR